MPTLECGTVQQELVPSRCVTLPALFSEHVVADIDFTWLKPVAIHIIVDPADDPVDNENARRRLRPLRARTQPTLPLLGVTASDQHISLADPRRPKDDHTVRHP